MQIIGGINKRVLESSNKQDINMEVMSKGPWMIKNGGYIPSMDHLVCPRAVYDNYVYYIDESTLKSQLLR